MDTRPVHQPTTEPRVEPERRQQTQAVERVDLPAHYPPQTVPLETRYLLGPKSNVVAQEAGVEAVETPPALWLRPKAETAALAGTPEAVVAEAVVVLGSTPAHRVQVEPVEPVQPASCGCSGRRENAYS